MTDKIKTECWAFVKPCGEMTVNSRFRSEQHTWNMCMGTRDNADIENYEAAGFAVIRVRVEEIE